MNQKVNFFYLLNGIACVGRFATEGDAATAAGGLGDGAQSTIVKGPEDLAGFSELELRTIRAATTITEPTENIVEAATKIVKGDSKAYKKNKDKAAEQKKTWAALEAKNYGDGVVSAAAAATPKESKPNAKGHLRKLFPTVGTRVAFDVMCKVDDKNQFTPSAVKTAVSDLKNAKYAGEGPVIFLQRDGADYVRTETNAPPPDVVARKEAEAKTKADALEKAQAEAKTKREAEKKAKADAAADAAKNAPAGTTEPVANPPGVTTGEVAQAAAA